MVDNNADASTVVTEIQGASSVHHLNNDPLFIHNNDHPGLSLVTDIFEGENFGDWKMSMKIALSAKNKLVFITGALPKPKTTDPTSARWIRCNDMLRAWLLNGLSKEIRRSVLYPETAKDIWDDLEARFGQVNGAQLYSVTKNLHLLVQGTSSISTYYTQMKIIWDELQGLRRHPVCTCDSLAEQNTIRDEERLVHFLMGLNDAYTSVRGNILMMKPLPSVSRAYSMLLQEEKQREQHAITVLSSENSALNAVINPSSQQKFKSEKKSLFCSNCKKTNHTVDRCYFLHGFPDNYRDKNKKTSGRFAGSALSELTSAQISKLLTLADGTSGNQNSTDLGDFAGFAGAFYEDTDGDW